MLRSFRIIAVLTLVCSAGLAAIGAGRQGGPASQTPGRLAPEVTLTSAASDIQIREGLVAGLLGTYGRSAVPTDFLAWQIATGAFREPCAGDTLGPDDRNRSQTWTRVDAGADGWIQNRALTGGYLYAVVNSALHPRIVVRTGSTGRTGDALMRST